MSPRSKEFLAEARERLAVARRLASEFPNAAVNPAYYAMLYAARAALSEEDRYAKTHSGTWLLFRQTFVETSRFDGQLVTNAEKAHEDRLGADYEAEQFEVEHVQTLINLASSFLAAVEELYPD